MKGTKKVCSLIIVDYYSMKKTAHYVEHVQSRIVNAEKLNVIIVDNAETDEGIEVLRQRYGKESLYDCKAVEGKAYRFTTAFGELVYYYANANLGYAKGNNIGTLLSDEIFDDEYYIISNNDLVLEKQLDWELFQNIFEQDKRIAVIGPRIVGKDGTPQSPHRKINAFMHLVAYYWIKGKPFHWRADHDYDGKSKKCYRVMGCFMIVKAAAFREAGRFDPNTFMFAEEMILSERLAPQGYCTYFYNDYVVVHDHGETVKKAMSLIQGYQRAFESCCYYYRRYRNASAFMIRVAELNFEVYKIYLRVLEKLKK